MRRLIFIRRQQSTAIHRARHWFSSSVCLSVRHTLVLCYKCSAVAEMGDRLATINMGWKLGAVPLFFGGGGLGPYLTQCGLGRVYLRTKWHLDPSSRLATTDMGRKLGGGAGSPSNTMRPTFVVSGILIHPAVWPQRTWAENWGAVPLLGRGAGFPSNIMWTG